MSVGNQKKGFRNQLFLVCGSVLGMLLLAGCLYGVTQAGSSEQRWELQGQLVYQDNNAIYLIKFPNLKRYKLYDSDTYIQSLTTKGSRYLVFDHCWEDCILKQFDLLTGEVQKLYPGEMPLYFESHDSFIFYRDEGLHQLNEKTGELTHIEGSPPRYPKRGSRGGDTYLVRVKSQPVAISDSEFVYVGSDYQLTKYNVETQAEKKLEIREVTPYFWRETTGKLFCEHWDIANDVFKLDLDTGKQLPFPIRIYGNGGMTYVPSHEKLIYVSNPWYSIIYWFINIPEAKFIYLYDFETKTSKQLGWGNPNPGIWLEPGTVDESLYKDDT